MSTQGLYDGAPPHGDEDLPPLDDYEPTDDPRPATPNDPPGPDDRSRPIGSSEAMIEDATGGETDAPAAESSWREIDLTAALTTPPPEPVRLKRSDGLHLAYPGRVHWLQGEPESCKSMLAQAEAAAIIGDGGHVLYIDFDADERDVVPRLRAMGCTEDQIRGGLHYVRPFEPLTTGDGGSRFTTTQLALEAQLICHRYGLVVIDGVTDALALEGSDLNNNTAVSSWITALPKRAAEVTGAAVLVIDHVTKSSENRGRNPIGAQSKLAAVNGATYSLETLTPPGRAFGSEPVVGQVKIVLQKDRGGYLRGKLPGRNPVAAIATITSYADDTLELVLDPPGEAEVIDNLKMGAEILKHLDRYPGASKNDIYKHATGKEEAIREQLGRLVDRKLVRVEPKGQSHCHYLTEDGKAEVPR